MADTRRKFCQLTLPDSPHTFAGPSHTHSHTGTQIAHWLCKQKQKWRHQWPPCPMVMMMAMMMIIAREAAFGGCYEIIDFVGRKGAMPHNFPARFCPTVNVESAINKYWPCPEVFLLLWGPRIKMGDFCTSMWQPPTGFDCPEKMGLLRRYLKFEWIDS